MKEANSIDPTELFDLDEPDEMISLAGRSACFTGKTHLGGKPLDRTDVWRMAKAKGVIIDKNVKRSTDFLVVMDPHSETDKMIAARRMGIEIVEDEVFWRVLGY